MERDVSLMDFHILEKGQQIDLYIPATQSYRHVYLIDVTENTIIVKDKNRANEDTKIEDAKTENIRIEDTKIEDPNIEDAKTKNTKIEDTPKKDVKTKLNIGKIYLMYIGKDKHVYCGKTTLMDVICEEDGAKSYCLEKPQQLTPQERRAGTRIKYAKEVFYKLDEATDYEFSKNAETVDLSRGGIGLIVSEYYKPGTILVIKLPIEDIDICARAKVNWIKPGDDDKYIVGMSFQNLFLSL